MRDNTIPADGCDPVSFVEIGLSRLEFCWPLQLSNILDQNLRAARSKQVLLVRIEFQSAHRSSIVDLRG